MSDAIPFRALVLSTARLALRAPTRNDISSIVKLANNLRVAQNLSTMAHPYAAADAAQWVDQCQRAAAPTIRLAVYMKQSDIFIGACGVGFSDSGSDVYIGYWIGEPYWGRGFATEAAHAVVGHAFSAFPIKRLWCTCRVTNGGSRRVMEKCGFQYHAAGMEYSRALGGTMPVERHCLDREVWEAEQIEEFPLTIQCH